jgi:exopolyphosphatase / guanosine-5'-triphosphate,3'-diphosphate pyrophosphatase
MVTHTAESTPPPSGGGHMRTAAVIDVGTSSIRMAVAEIAPDGEVRTLETLSQGVSLGKDTFTTGQINRQTIEDSVRVLRSYRQKLQEYQISDPAGIRVVATSAVREAANRLAFLDRIYVGTGFNVEPLDEAEVHRITYRSIRPHLSELQEVLQSRVVIVEVGGGSTELLLVESGEVSYSHSYRLGSLRLRENLHGYRASAERVREIMENQIRRTLEQLPTHIDVTGRSEMVTLGGDMRFAARELLDEWDPETLARVDVSDLEHLASDLLDLSEDEIVRKYRVPFPEAETLGPALLVYLELARILDLKTVHVSNANLRDGLLQEMVVDTVWTADYRNQIIRSAIALARKYHVDLRHCKHVAKLCGVLFDALHAEHQLDTRDGLILHLGALLHEVGAYVNQSSMHKHSMYIILNSDLFGMTREDLTLVALVARYHRRAAPKPTHPYFNNLDRRRRVAVSKMAALLRIADALDASRSQRINDIESRIEKERLVITAHGVDDVSLEQLTLRQAGHLFEEVFGLRVLLRSRR